MKLLRRFALLGILAVGTAVPITLAANSGCECPPELPECCDCRQSCSGDGVCVHNCGGCVASLDDCALLAG